MAKVATYYCLSWQVLTGVAAAETTARGMLMKGCCRVVLDCLMELRGAHLVDRRT